MPNDAQRRLRVLTWHVHGNYLYYLTQAHHDFHLVTKPGNPPGYAGAGGVLPWGANVHEVPAEQVASQEFDVILFQHKTQWDDDRVNLLSDAQRRLPRVYIEHDPPQENPFEQRHWVDDSDTLLVHVTHFNKLMWDCGATPTRVIEHGVIVPDGVRYTGEKERGIVVINHLRQRGRRLGNDVYADVIKHVPLDLVGMDAQSAGGLGEIGNLELAAFSAQYRFFFNPIRWTSLGLAIVEAMTIGMPIIGLATTELATVIRNGESGYIDTNVAALVDAMQRLIRDPKEARLLGDGARKVAMERFHIDRFVADWNETLRHVTS
ncbi:MAG: glycosyltransferase family 4 protein [Pseudomonadota bacterium]|uniref:glycosyltransferase family 4 protein n=1 Tax=Burkholderia sp. PAMC 28687 TaxID=1795874 RepID=UPI000785D47E|nr:glycosyltransferase family 4 protein [Burkholderia sp. PAMC 28687]AMM17446.1 transferase [Burkholderia sp. PAMC 28687]MDP9153478.1 glycosyltransferase family 4 protein [Pseudomonadota bacterium]